LWGGGEKTPTRPRKHWEKRGDPLGPPRGGEKEPPPHKKKKKKKKPPSILHEKSPCWKGGRGCVF